MRRVKAKGGKTFAHVLGKGTIEIQRQKQRFIVTGQDFQIIGTSPDGTEKLVLAVENGILIDDGLEFKDEGDPTDEEREALEAAGGDPNAIDETDTEEKGLAGATKPNGSEEESED